MHYDYEQERFVMDVPTECPKCGAELEPDISEEQQILLCPNCEYEFDATNELKKISEVCDNE